jgi:hypothetical protein
MKHEPRVWDTLILGDELDMLECRLTELAESKVYRHVIAEAKTDHQGHPKPYHFLENRERFAPFWDRIVYVQVGELPSGPGNWQRIWAQRDAIGTHGLEDARWEDIIIYSDCDEIITPEGVRMSLVNPGGLICRQQMAAFAVDWLHPDRWLGPRSVMAGNFHGHFRNLREIKSFPVADDGWHLTWLGGNEAIRRKLTQYCHPELTSRILLGLAEDRFCGQGYAWGGGQFTPTSEDVKLKPAEVDETYPKWIRERKCPEEWFRPREALFPPGITETEPVLSSVLTPMRSPSHGSSKHARPSRTGDAGTPGDASTPGGATRESTPIPQQPDSPTSSAT